MLTMLRKTLKPYVGWVCCWFSHAPRGFPPGTPVFPSPEKKQTNKQTKQKKINLRFLDASAYDTGNADNNSNDNEGDHDNGNNSQ